MNSEKGTINLATAALLTIVLTGIGLGAKHLSWPEREVVEADEVVRSETRNEVEESGSAAPPLTITDIAINQDDEIDVDFSNGLVIGDACSYFGESMPTSAILFESDEEAEDVIKRIVDASGLSQNFSIRAAGVPNAAAVIHGSTRHILYNQYFMRDTRRRTNSAWGPVSIMAHEVGHHLNGHTLESGGSRPAIELQADYFSGYIVQRMGGTLDDSRLAMSILASDAGSATHPAKHDRLAAITNGWSRACSGDSACRGSSPTPSPTPTPGPGPGPATDPTLPPVGRRPDPRPDPPPRPSGPDSCEYARDGECDEPDLCDRGTDTSDCRVLPPPPAASLYCCDQFGRKWCPIVVNAGPVGTPCMCAGVAGSGWMCN